MTQIEYLELLFNDCGFDTRAARNDFCSLRARRPIKYLDELNSYERSQLINELKDRKVAAMKPWRDDRDPRGE
ncbi:MAG TPA: hypothetical protein VJQ59_16775 [Candidatus Sulfotelmatobacter sp.]|nr:hypothetical protein [Candidatus Sulfotelmatobacter sp.]